MRNGRAETGSKSRGYETTKGTAMKRVRKDRGELVLAGAGAEGVNGWGPC